MSTRKVNPKKRTYDVAFDLTNDPQFGKPLRPIKRLLPSIGDEISVQNPSTHNQVLEAVPKFNFGAKTHLNSAVAAQKFQPNLVGNDDSRE